MYLISAIYYYTDVSFLCTCTKKPVGEDVYDVEEEEEEDVSISSIDMNLILWWCTKKPVGEDVYDVEEEEEEDVSISSIDMNLILWWCTHLLIISFLHLGVFKLQDWGK